MEALSPGAQRGVQLVSRQGVEFSGVKPLEELVLEAESRIVALLGERELPELAMKEEVPLRNVEGG